MKTQPDSILLVIQIQNNGRLVNNVVKAHGGKQMMITPNGLQLPLIIKNGLLYLENYTLQKSKQRKSPEKNS